MNELLTSCTDEQLKYIIFDKKEDTKLIACAGSGKTQSIVLRMQYLIDNNIYTSDNILMLTFSRFTQNDFINRLDKLKNNNFNITINYNLIKTIDSYAKSIIDVNNKIDVSLLSYRFMLLLESDTQINLNNIKIIFIDEAQDLNEIQYRICKALHDKYNIVINFIGDPNQNIYQFRNSSEKYFMAFETPNIFYLTHNFRSSPNIVNFSQYLRPFNNIDIKCTKQNIDLKPLFLFVKTNKEFEINLIRLLNEATKYEINFKDIAIIAPTRGVIKGTDKSKGLCFITNILHKYNFKFKQFYEEATDEVSTKLEYKPENNKLNILTYMGSKGLEWKHVIIVDANICLINKRDFNDNKHNYDRYLLYVACSRAIDNMFIFSNYNVTHNGIIYKINPWFSLIPTNLYDIENTYLLDTLQYPNVKSIKTLEKECRITKIIDNLNEQNLDKLSNIIEYDNLIRQINKIFDIQPINCQTPIFLGRYIELFYFTCYKIKYREEKRRFSDIENIITNNYIYDNERYDVADWFYKHKSDLSNNILTWESINNLVKDKNNKDINIIEYIYNKFDKSIEVSKHTFISDKFYYDYIIKEKEWMKRKYDKYIDASDFSHIKKIVFNISLILYSIDTQHYFHINNCGKKFRQILTSHNDLLNKIITYVNTHNHLYISTNVLVSNNNLIGEIDMLDFNNRIWELKCVSDINLKHILQLLMYNIIYFKLDESNNMHINVYLNFINFIKGEEIFIDLHLTIDKIKQIINIFTNITN